MSIDTKSLLLHQNELGLIEVGYIRRWYEIRQK